MLFSTSNFKLTCLASLISMKKSSISRVTFLASIVAAVALLSGAELHAQHTMHGMSEMGEAAMTSMPSNDEVLTASPDHLMLQFESAVTLVKLAVKNPEGKMTDINFRFDPKPGMHFMQMLPKLEQIDFYRVEWAILNGNGELVKGQFHFSFGPDAKPPSFYLDQMEMPAHMMSPDYRLL